jgi:hypothetical protein
MLLFPKLHNQKKQRTRNDIEKRVFEKVEFVNAERKPANVFTFSK